MQTPIDFLAEIVVNSHVMKHLVTQLSWAWQTAASDGEVVRNFAIAKRLIYDDLNLDRHSDPDHG
jgi:hypothetical protein